MYIPRTLEKTLLEVAETFPVVLLTGPRQVGKTTLFAHAAGEGRRVVTLDHPAARAQARNDPELFLQAYPPPVLIDEIQYAPELFPFIKIHVDHERRPGMFWLTGSQQFAMMRNVSESLAGRVGILDLLGLSQSEIAGEPSRGTFLDSLLAVPGRRPHRRSFELRGLYANLVRGAFPALHERPATRIGLFYSSYVKTYVERDIRDVLNVSQESVFLAFLRVLAARTAQLVNYTDIARDLGLAPNTVKAWMSLLESSRLIYLLHPWHSNRTNRAVKTPKLYFTDTGLCAHLAGWSTPEALESGAMSGAMLETHVVVEIVKSFWNQGIDAPLHFYRDKDKREIDLVVESDGMLHPVEIKKTAAPTLGDVRHFKLLDGLGAKRGPGAVVCLASERVPLAPDIRVMNIADI
jgi:predicted AAA+ superfamily ATPase